MTQMRQCGYPLRSKLAPAAVAALLLTAGTGGSALSFAATGASATNRGNGYPPPVKSRGGALSYCPSASGLEKFDEAAEGMARTGSLRYGRVSSTVDLATELTEMIQAQSAYEANSKVFQTGANILDILNGLKP